MSPSTRRWPVRLLLVLGGVLAALGLVAGHLNRQVLDGPTFAANVDDLRKDPAVARQVGEAVTNQLLEVNPDLVALRPLVVSVAAEVAASSVLSGPVQIAASQAHGALTDPDGSVVVLRIADLGAVVAGALAVLAPEKAPDAQQVSVTLAEVGGQSFADTTLTITRWLGVLAWLLPLLSLACLVGAVVLSPDRWLGAARAGLALLAAAAAVGLVLAIGGFVLRRLDDSTLGGAVARAGWDVFVRPLWTGVVVTALVGLVVTLAAGAAVPQWLGGLAGRARALVLDRPSTAAGTVARGVALALVGLAALLDPLGMLELAALLGGVLLAVVGVSQVAGVAARSRQAREAAAPEQESVPAPSRRWLPVAAVAVLVLVVGVVWVARPGRDVAAAPPVDASDGCNGHVELCDRRFDEVAYVASHNSMAVAGEPGWFIGEHAVTVPVQLDTGVRALLVDVWAGRPAGSIVRTAPDSFAEAEQVVEDELGPEVAEAARRLADSVAGAPEGPEALYLCHGLCEIGSTKLSETLGELRAWLTVNPNEVVTLFIEDHVTSDRIAADITAAGLLPFVHAPVAGEPFPTLGEMVASGRRLVVMVEEGDGGEAAPWLVNGFEFTQDTPYTFPTVESFSCDENRGPADAPLFLLNHWLSGFATLVTNAETANALDVLGARAEECQAARGQIPNFVAVNYTTIGDVDQVVDDLNGVAAPDESATTTTTDS